MLASPAGSFFPRPSTVEGPFHDCRVHQGVSPGAISAPHPLQSTVARPPGCPADGRRAPESWDPYASLYVTAVDCPALRKSSFRSCRLLCHFLSVSLSLSFRPRHCPQLSVLPRSAHSVILPSPLLLTHLITSSPSPPVRPSASPTSSRSLGTVTDRPRLPCKARKYLLDPLTAPSPARRPRRRPITRSCARPSTATTLTGVPHLTRSPIDSTPCRSPLGRPR